MTPDAPRPYIEWKTGVAFGDWPTRWEEAERRWDMLQQIRAYGSMMSDADFYARYLRALGIEA